MAKEDGAKTVVVGGSRKVQQQYCGVVGGQSADFSAMDTEIKVRQPIRHCHFTIRSDLNALCNSLRSSNNTLWRHLICESHSHSSCQ
jgi:hypothetical protein